MIIRRRSGEKEGNELPAYSYSKVSLRFTEHYRATYLSAMRRQKGIYRLLNFEFDLRMGFCLTGTTPVAIEI